MLQYIIWAYIYKRKVHWRRDRLPTPVFLDFPCGSAGKEAACNAGDLGLLPGLGRSSEEEKSYPFQYSGLENSMDYIVHGVTESGTTEQLSLSRRQWRAGNLGTLQFMGLQRVRHDWATFTFIEMYNMNYIQIIPYVCVCVCVCVCGIFYARSLKILQTSLHTVGHMMLKKKST